MCDVEKPQGCVRVLDDHLVLDDPNLEAVIVNVFDEPDDSGACHWYGISTKSGDGVYDVTEIKFQKGPIAEVGVNGGSVEALLAIVADRLKGFQSGPFACDANEEALTHAINALAALNERTQDRLARGVEGKNEA